MSGKIFHLSDTGQATPLPESPYETESVLQELLAKHPDFLPGDQINPTDPRRWVLVKREMGVPDEASSVDRWSLDHLYLDQAGIPTLVEVKRGTNTDVRRKVVGQMLDYAANAVVNWSIGAIRASFAAQCEEDNKSPEVELDRLLGEGADVEAFWKEVETNFQAGRIRMIFVADTIPSELRRIIDFLNRQLRFAEVLALELKRYAGESIVALVPRMYGQRDEPRANVDSDTTRQPTSEQVFLQEFASNNSARAQWVLRQVISWCRQQGLTDGFRKGSGPAVYLPEVPVPKESTPPPFVISCRGVMSIRMKFLIKRAPFSDPSLRNELHSIMRELPCFSLGQAGMCGFPNLTLDAISDDGNLQKVLNVMDWVVRQIREFATKQGTRDQDAFCSLPAELPVNARMHNMQFAEPTGEVTSAEIDAILSFLPIFETEGFRFGDWKTPDGELPWYQTSEEALRFIQSLYDNGWVVSFDWPEWTEIAGMYVKDAHKLDEADLNTIRRLLTTHVRQEKFCEGHMAQVFECGHLVAILRRLKAMRELLP